MRKLFLCAAAAIVALASCSKTQVINTEVPQEIGFKAVTGAMTKAEQSTVKFTQDLGVFAYVNYVGNATDGTLYFGNTQFKTTTTTTTWNAEDTKYWPVYDNLDFVIYSPFKSGTTDGTKFVYNDKLLTVVADNSGVQDDGTGAIEVSETDYLYGEKFFNNNGSGFARQDAAVSVNLKHAMAKIYVKIRCTNAVIQSVVVNKAVLKGKYTVDYDDTTIKPVWSDMATAVERSIYNNTNGEKDVDAYVLVVPQTNSSITFTYQIAGSENSLTYTIGELDANWEHGKCYTYNVTLTPKEIKFKPTVTDWTSAEGTNPTL